MSADPSSSGFVGYAGPPSFHGTNVEKFVFRRRMARAAVATLVQIVRAPYDASGNAIAAGSPVAIGYVDVQPLVNQLDGLGNPMPHGVVYHASYVRQQGGANAIIADPAVGDIGKFVMADRDTSVVKATNQQSNPGSGRRNSFADGTYIGASQGPLSGASATPPTQYLTFPANGIMLRDKSGNEVALVSDTNLTPPGGTAPAQTVGFTSSGIQISDRNGNSVVLTSAGITITSAVKVEIVAPLVEVKVNTGDSTFFVETTSGASGVLKAAV